jgi:hypothetical protein
VTDPEESQPLPIEEFVDLIDSHSRYFQGAASSVHDFQEKLTKGSKVSSQN